MTTRKFRNLYRVDSHRRQNWDYSSCGAYFITIVTKNRNRCLGYVRNGHMHLSPLGVVANNFIADIPNHSRNVRIGNHVVMPDHVHLILKIYDEGDDVLKLERMPEKEPLPESLPESMSAPGEKNRMSEISPKANTVSTIIRSYKASVTRELKRLGCDFAWHDRFHDRIIRSLDEYEAIHRYITNNPQNWGKPKVKKK